MIRKSDFKTIVIASTFVFLLFGLLEVEAGEVKALYIETEKSIMTNRTWLIPQDEESKGFVNLGIEYDFNKTFYLNQRVETEFTRQFRYIGYKSELGVRVLGVDIYYRHFSGHAMDFNYGRPFPESNAIGVRWNMIK